MGWVGKVLKDHGAMGWLGWEGPQRSKSHGMVGLEGSSKIIEPWDGWVGRVLKGRRAMGWVGRVLEDHRSLGGGDWKGPKRSWCHEMVGLDGSLKIIEP